ncbi:hypothetical protein ACHAWF_006504 [Thalassiosira exigua]
MSPKRGISWPMKPKTKRNMHSSASCLHVAVISVSCISSAAALSQNPTSRYLKEMGRLLDHHQEHHVAAVPSNAEPQSGTDATSGGGDNSGDASFEQWEQYQPSSLFSASDASDLNGEPSPLEARQKRFQNPHPPTDPYFQRQKELFKGYYSQNQTPNGSVQRQSRAQSIEKNDRPPRGAELFHALNEQIEALDQQMQSSSSFGNDVDGQFSDTEPVEWDYTEYQDDYFPVDDGVSQFEYVDTDKYASVQQPEDFFNEAEQYQIHEEASNIALRQELERMAAEKRVAEEVARRAQQELREKERLERERAEQERVTAARAEAARAELKKALERELARFEEQKRRSREVVSIAKSRRILEMPNTNDPFELLGLDYRNPPETAEEIRRAFLKMAKKYHPDAVASDATREERERASLYFARINSAYQLLKDKQEMLGDEYFATMMGGPMYEPRNSHIRQSFSRGYGFDDYSSMFTGNSYSARYGPMHGRQSRAHNGNKRRHNYGQTKNPFRRQRQEVGDNCHVSGKDFPPFFNT